MASFLTDDHGRRGLGLTAQGRLDAPPARRYLPCHGLPAPVLPTADIEHVHVTGQSGGGWIRNNSWDDLLLQTRSLFGSLMLAAGVYSDWQDAAPPVGVVPLEATKDGLPATTGHTPAFGMTDLGRLLIDYSAPSRRTQYLVSGSNAGGQPIETIVPGGYVDDATFYHGVRQTARAKNEADALGLSYHQPYHLFVHGESDRISGGAAAPHAAYYLSRLLELYEAVNGRGVYSPSAHHLAATSATNHREAAEQPDDIRLFLVALSADSIRDGICPVSWAQYQAHRDLDGVTLVCPSYMHETHDGDHPRAPLAHLYGQHAAFAYHHELTTGRPFVPVSPIESSLEVTESGGTYSVSLRFNAVTPGCPLEFDTRHVFRAPGMGFTLLDGAGQSISGEPTLDENRITITASAAPSFITYAMLHTPQILMGVTGHRGNLRDGKDYAAWNTAAHVGGEPIPFYHWCIPFAIAL